MNKKEFNSVVLGALLHDIGKFMQRAGIKQTSADIEHLICRKTRDTSYYGYRHVLWTHSFFDMDLINWSRDEFDIPTAQNTASYHHNPDTSLQTIVQVADWLSSGGDRPDAPTEEEQDKKARRYFKKQPLWSIFNRVFSEKGKVLSDKEYKKHKLERLLPDDHIFPQSSEDYSEEKYKKLWNEFEIQLKQIPDTLTFSQFIDTVVALLEQYTWCIPANTQEDFPDVSLYDHLRTTAAITACLYQYHDNDNSLNDDIKIRNSSGDIEKFLFLSADLSGIQNYIFNLSKEQSKGVSKILRARSFYLATITKAIGFSILRQLDLPNVCNLQDAGGRMLFLIPNTVQTREKLQKAKQVVEKWFFNNFYGALTMNLIVYPLKGSDFKQKKFSSIMRKVNNLINQSKRQKLYSTLTHNAKWKQDTYVADMSYKGGRCVITGTYPATETDDFGGELEGEKKISRQCMLEKKIGQKLPASEYIIYSLESGKSDMTILSGTPYEINIKLLTKDTPPKHYDTSMLRIEKLSYSASHSYLPIYPTARIVPHNDKKEILTFEDIANQAVDYETGKGSAMLGVFKADVDNLGFIFGNGFGGKVSLSKYVTLSRMMNFFFTARIPQLIEKSFPNIYTVFAGGDDLTLIGSWYTIQNFSQKLYLEFKKFTASNPNITLSAGISVVHSKYPIRRAIEVAEEYLEKSKKKKEENDVFATKNRITYFDTTVTWETYSELLDYAARLDEAYQFSLEEGKGVTMGFLYRLLTYHKMALKTFSEELSPDMHELLWTSQLHYDVARNINRDKHENLIMMLKEEEKMKTLKIPLFSVMYKNRKTSQKEDK